MRKNSEASSEYQQLLLYLETLRRAISRLEGLKPGNNDSANLESIRAAAQSCKISLNQFLGKIEKFETRLGTWNRDTKNFATFSRRMQWRLIYHDDVQELQAALGVQVGAMDLMMDTHIA